MQRCHACGIDKAFQAQIIMSIYDIPEAMLDARFLHRMVDYPDNEYDPHVKGMNPYHGIISARPDLTWPISRHWEELHSFRADEELDMDLVVTVAERVQEWSSSVGGAGSILERLPDEKVVLLQEKHYDWSDRSAGVI